MMKQKQNDLLVKVQLHIALCILLVLLAAIGFATTMKFLHDAHEGYIRGIAEDVVRRQEYRWRYEGRALYGNTVENNTFVSPPAATTNCYVPEVGGGYRPC
jgi:hypothetical protein